MLSLETLSNFTPTSQSIKVCEKNESESLNKEQLVKKQEHHITQTSKIKHNLEEVKENTDMVDAETLNEVSFVNPHVSEITHQDLRILTNVLSMICTRY